MKPLLTHTATQFKQNEINTLEYIQARGFFDNDFSELANAIYTTFNKYRAKTNVDFFFVADFEMDIERHKHRVVTHAEIKGNYDFTSYSIGICGQAGSNELIRRFHFDYDHDKPRNKQKAFISHLQYGGKSGTGYTGIAYGTNNIESGLSVPRLNFPPINLALLLDIVFCEFQNEKTKKIIEDPEWRSLIKDNEIFMLREYFRCISNHIGSVRHDKDLLVRDICYA
jgi:hypothetical protein